MGKITQLVKGFHCNAKCPMCLSLNNAYGHPQSDRLGKGQTAAYLSKLSKVFLDARNTFSDELVITSFGDPLDSRNAPEMLPQEIRLAVLAGFYQITLITNGIGLKEDLLASLVKSGLTHMTFSIHATSQEDYEKFMGVRYPLEQTLQKSLLVSSYGVTVRHNYLWHRGLSVEAVMTQAKESGATQVTLLEGVPANAFSVQEHTPLPELPSGAVLKQSYAWGMDIYHVDELSIALCSFGQDDPEFSFQYKNLYINVLTDGKIVFREGSYFNLEDGVLKTYA